MFLKNKWGRFVVLVSTILVAGGCSRVEAPEDAWYRGIGKGIIISIPFSHDLEVLGFRGWRFLGKLPRSARQADIVQYSLWHEVWEGEIEPNQISSGRPPPGTYHGAWNMEDAESLRVDIDILLERSMEIGRPVYTERILVNGQQHRRPLELPEAYRYEMMLEKTPDQLEIKAGEPILLATGRFRSWSQGDDGKPTRFLKERTFRWYLLIDSTRGEEMPGE
jgi:hypothetical protein